MEQVVELFASPVPPSSYGRPLSHWTETELADEMVAGYQHFSSCGKTLEEAQIKPHQIRYWLTPPRI